MDTPKFLFLNEFVKPVALRVVPDRPPTERIFGLIIDNDGLTNREISERLSILENTVRCCIHRLMHEGSIKRAPKVEGERRVRWIAGVDDRIAQKIERTFNVNQRMVSEWEPMNIPKQGPFSALFQGEQ